MNDLWKFTHFTSDRYLYHERWERDERLLKEELMMIVYNIEPLTGTERMKKSTHYGSRNAWYHYKKVRDRGVIEVWATGENMEKPYSWPHYFFKVEGL